MSIILVTGSKGQVGSEIGKISKNFPKYEFIFADRTKMPLEDTDKILKYLQKIEPNIIISAGAYTAVDNAENEKELANQINNLALDVISKWCAENNSKLIHISTDYIFDGKSEIPYKEEDVPKPINWYGETKLRGERAIQNNLDNAVIIRTSWVYSEFGNNFVKTMMRLMKERESIKVVNDQIGSPTYALDLANAIMKIASSEKWKAGIYNYSNKGEISWYDFAVSIKEIGNFNCEVIAVTSAQFPTIAKRPNYSLLDKTKIENTYNISAPFWRDSLKECLVRLT